MAKNKIRQTLLAALPVRSVRQRQSSLVSPPDVYASVALPASESQPGGGSNPLDQLLQASLKDVSTAVSDANKQLASLLPVQQQHLDTITQNTQALVNNTAAKSGSGSSALSTIGSLASGFLGAGSILTPIIGGLMNLFGRSSTSQATLTPFTMPAPIHLDTTVGAAPPPAAQQNTSTDRGSNAGGAAQSIQIQVNAMDSRSFIDHSDQIAQAVRLALLNSHPLADVIAEI